MEYRAVAGSSNIMGVAYDANNQQLFVEFKSGTRYRYDGVDEGVYDDFMASTSKGQFFHNEIKDVYPAVRV